MTEHVLTPPHSGPDTMPDEPVNMPRLKINVEMVSIAALTLIMGCKNNRVLAPNIRAHDIFRDFNSALVMLSQYNKEPPEQSRFSTLLGLLHARMNMLDNLSMRLNKKPIDFTTLLPAFEGDGPFARADWAKGKASMRDIVHEAAADTLRMIEAARTQLESAQLLEPGRRAVLKREVEGTASDEVFHAWAEFNRFAEWQTEALAKRPDEIDLDIGAFRQKANGGADDDLMHRSMARLHETITTGLEADPLSLALRTGVIDSLSPLPMTGELMLTRKQQAETVAEHYDRPLALFVAGELKTLNDMFRANPPLMLEMRDILDELVGKENARRALMQISNSAGV